MHLLTYVWVHLTKVVGMLLSTSEPCKTYLYKTFKGGTVFNEERSLLIADDIMFWLFAITES